MRDIPTALQEALDGGATTLARCWLVTRRDGVALGFTDHDRALSIDGQTFEPESGFTASAIEVSTGLSVDTHSVSGALRSSQITEADIQKGLYDAAEVELYLADWRDTTLKLLLSRGRIGEIRRSGQSFQAEIVGLADALSQPVGRSYLHSCSCRLGDAECGIDLSDPSLHGIGTVIALGDGRQITADGLPSFESGVFAGGLLSWTSGQNAGLQSQVRTHLTAEAESFIELWVTPALDVAIGDQFSITAGCNKTAEMCAGVFDNLENFRGFPHIPGDDVAAAYPSTGGSHDGGSLFNR